MSLKTRLFHWKLTWFGDKEFEKKYTKTIPCKECGKMFKSYIHYGHAGYTYNSHCNNCLCTSVFIYDAPHWLHQEWADAVNARPCHYASGFIGKLIPSQLCSLFTTAPKADMYICESVRCLLPAIKRKMFDKDIKILCINSDTFFHDYKSYSLIVKKICNFYMSFIDGFISTSEYVKKLDKYSKKPHKIVYPYVDYERYSKLDIDLKDRDISTIGNVCKFRGTDLLIKAYLELENKNKPLRLNIVGREAERFEKNIDKHIYHYVPPKQGIFDLEFNMYEDYGWALDWNPELKSINITGRTEYPENYLTGTYMNVARHDSFGINVLEAMSAGIPPIVSTNVGAKEIVPKELICNLKVKDIVRKYNWLNKDIKRKRKLGKICQKIAKGFTKQKSMRGFIDVFNNYRQL